MKVYLRKQQENDDSGFTIVYFNSTAKTVIGFKDGLYGLFQGILYRLDNWFNNGSAWTIEYIDGEYINISNYNPLSGSTNIELPDKLKHPKKGLINIKNDDNKCFLWCHVRHLNPLNKKPQRR